MAVPTAPLFGFGASGQLGKAIVYGRWKGIPVARRYVIPANPKTVAQQLQRSFMTFANDDWHLMLGLANADDVQAWRVRASQLGPMSGFNAFCQMELDGYRASRPMNGVFEAFVVTDPTHDSLDLTIHVYSGGVDVVEMFGGPSLGYQTSIQTAPMVGGVATLAAFDTGQGAGSDYFMWFQDATGGFRSGVYKFKLT